MKGARKLRLIPVNPVEDVERPKVEEREMQTLTDEEATRLLAAASTTRIYVPIVLALATGLRRGGLLALHWQDIDLSTCILEVVCSLEQTSAGRRFKTTKRSGGSPDSFTSWVARVAKRAGTSHIMPVHGLRRTHITNLLRANVHPKVASERAGHSRVGFALDRYSHVIPSLQEDAAPRIDAAFPQDPHKVGWQMGGKSPSWRGQWPAKSLI